MKSEDELRRERRIGWIAVVTLVPMAAALYVTVRFVTTHHLVPAGSMIPTIHRRDRVVVNRIEVRGLGDVPWHDRSHFFAMASRIMRRILVDHWGAKMAQTEPFAENAPHRGSS